MTNQSKLDSPEGGGVSSRRLKGGHFYAPVDTLRLRHPRASAPAMAMPETTVQKARLPSAAKSKVGTPGKRAVGVSESAARPAKNLLEP